MSKNDDTGLIKKADEFIAKYALQENKDVKEAALMVRPEMKPDSAIRWGHKVLADPTYRQKLHAIEQGAIVKVYELIDDAIDTLAKFIRDEGVSKNVRMKAIDLVLKRVIGGIPDTVILAKFSLFDGEEKRSTLKDEIRKKLEAATYERVADS